MQMTKLRQHLSAGLTPVSTPVEVQRYTRAFVMDLFGSVMFPDSSGDVFSMMYLPLLENLESPQMYNWGGPVLTHLYHSLCHACKKSAKQMFGPILLLQH